MDLELNSDSGPWCGHDPAAPAPSRRRRLPQDRIEDFFPELAEEPDSDVPHAEVVIDLEHLEDVEQRPAREQVWPFKSIREQIIWDRRRSWCR